MKIYDFRQLQELELVVGLPSSPYKDLLSSITSLELRKIILVRRADLRLTEAWTLIDEQLCKLVGQLHGMGYRHTLEAELRFTKITHNPKNYDFTKFLTGFRENGVVNIIVNGDRLHSSAHDR